MNAMSAPAAPDPSRRWLFGPVPDLLLGCGVGYGLVFLFQLFDPSLLRALVPAGAAPLVILLSGTPHYGATLLRVYERAEDRRAYALFTVWITAALAALFVAGVRDAWIGSLLLTVYLTWSPWHYSGQNYGVALMFLGRRGVAVPPLAKRFFHASFFLSFVLTFLAQHAARGGPGYAPFADGGDAIRMLSLGIPSAFASPGLALAGLAYVVCVGVAFAGFLRSGSVRDVAPAAILTATQALWFAVPVLAREWKLFPSADPFAPGSASYAFLWIAAGHSLQYLWVTTFYAARTAGAAGRARYLGKSLLAGAAIWNVPLLAFGPIGLGWSHSDAGLTAVIAAVVNLHHFLLDGAIWKLRDGRVAQILIRSQRARAEAGAAAPAAAPGLPWFRTLAFAAGAVCVAFILVRTYEREVGFRAALQSGDLPRATLAAERLARIGLDGAGTRLALGRGFEAAGQFEPAAQQYAEALALEPENVDALHRRGVALLALGRDAEARESLERAVSLAPEQKLISMNLARARARTTRSAEPPALPSPAAGSSY